MFLFLCDLVNFEALVITIAVVFGVIVLGLLVCCCCCCVRCKKTQPRWDGRAPLYRSRNVVAMCASRGVCGGVWTLNGKKTMDCFDPRDPESHDLQWWKCFVETPHAFVTHRAALRISTRPPCAVYFFLAQSSTFSHVLARALFHPAQNWMFQPNPNPHLMTIIRIG